jgi:hypothetical protein
MATDPEQSTPAPTEMKGGTPPDSDEVERKGEWAGTAEQGIVPPELGGAGASEEMLPPDPELQGSVVGQTTGSEEPATEEGIDLSAGDDADATAVERPDPPGAENVEPELRASDAIQAVRDYDKTKAAP